MVILKYPSCHDLTVSLMAIHWLRSPRSNRSLGSWVNKGLQMQMSYTDFNSFFCGTALTCHGFALSTYSKQCNCFLQISLRHQERKFSWKRLDWESNPRLIFQFVAFERTSVRTIFHVSSQDLVDHDFDLWGFKRVALRLLSEEHLFEYP